MSNEGAKGITPCALTLPCVGLNPNTPTHAAGTRTLPPLSVPSASVASPQTDTAAPEDEPPGILPRAFGFTGAP